jgi:SAM-dependent methyltransferase
MSRVVDEHRQYLADQPRLDAFRRAVGAVVKPGDVVLDLGAGTGILGLLAAEAGAARVYSVEATSLIGLTRQIATANGLSDRYTFVKELSTLVRLPEKVDVVMADQIGRFGFEAGVFEFFADARERLMAPEGRTIPSVVEMWAAPVERPDLWANVDFWGQRPAGFEMAPAREIAVNTGYPIHLQPEELLAPPALLLAADPGEPVRHTWQMRSSYDVARPGTLHGVGGWFAAELAPGVHLSNSPLDPARIARRNVFFPFDRPVPVEPGHRVDVTIQAMPNEVMVSWAGQVFGPGDDQPLASFSHSTWKGMLLSSEDLQRTRPTYVPRLTARGEARRTVLELCDGATPLAEVETELRRRHPALLATAREAQVFVAEVVTRYTTDA